MSENATGREGDIAIKFALQTLARAALKELVETRGVGGWLDEFEEGVILALKNRIFPGVAMDRERAVVGIATAAVSTLIREARGFRGDEGTSVIIPD